MFDCNERIIQQLMTIYQQVNVNSGGLLQTVDIDRADLDDIQRPAIILLTGKEETATPYGGQSLPTGMPGAYFWMRPQTWVLLKQRDTLTNATLNQQPDPVDQELRFWRRLILPAVLQDDNLIALSQGGRVEYRGYDTDMQSGSSMGAEGAMMNLHFAISYPLNYADLI